MAKTVKEAYGEIVRLRNEAYKKWMETPTDDEYNRVVTKAKFQAYEKCMELLTPSIVDHQPEEPMTADKVNLDRCICDIDLVASGREDCERIRKHIRAIRRIFAGLPEESASDDLEEVAGNYAMNELNVFGNQDGWTENGAVYDMIKATARHFANWQREQIMMEAMEGQITLNEMGNPCVMLPSRFNAGDEVKLIVLKEDKV